LHIGVLVGTGRRERVRRNRDDHVGLADLPTVRKRWSRRHVLRIAFKLGAVRPGFDGLHFYAGQTRIVRPLAIMWVGEPWRHLAREHRFLNRRCPRLRILVGEQRHRRDIVRMMARHAMLIKNGRDVVSKRGFARENRGGNDKSGNQDAWTDHLTVILALEESSTGFSSA